MRYYYLGGIGRSTNGGSYVDAVVEMHPADKRFNAVSSSNPMYIINTKSYYEDTAGVSNGGFNDGLDTTMASSHPYTSGNKKDSTSNFIIIQNTY